MTTEKGAHELTTREARGLVGVGPITFAKWAKRFGIKPYRSVKNGNALPSNLWLKGDIERLIAFRKAPMARRASRSGTLDATRVARALSKDPVKIALETQVNDLVEKRIAQIFGRQPELVG